jgi:hypothetical protein
VVEGDRKELVSSCMPYGPKVQSRSKKYLIYSSEEVFLVQYTVFDAAVFRALSLIMLSDHSPCGMQHLKRLKKSLIEIGLRSSEIGWMKGPWFACGPKKAR